MILPLLQQQDYDENVYQLKESQEQGNSNNNIPIIIKIGKAVNAIRLGKYNNNTIIDHNNK